MRPLLVNAGRVRAASTRATIVCTPQRRCRNEQSGGRGRSSRSVAGLDRKCPPFTLLDPAHSHATIPRKPTMPKTIAAPFPHGQANAETNVRERTRADKQAWRAESADVRVAALEGRWEATVPTLATIADLRGVENRLIVWILGAAGTLLLSLLGIFFAGYNSLNSRIDSAVTELRAETRASIADLKDETRSSIAELRAEMREANARMDSKFDALMAELRSQRSDSR